MLSSMSKSGSFSNPMSPFEDAMANELVLDNTVEQTVQEREDVEVIDQACFFFTVIFD
jgi:hypothetical protein